MTLRQIISKSLEILDGSQEYILERTGGMIIQQPNENDNEWYLEIAGALDNCAHTDRMDHKSNEFRELISALIELANE